MKTSNNGGSFAARSAVMETSESNILIAVPLLAILASGLAALIQTRFGLYGAAFVLGWAQLVGL